MRRTTAHFAVASLISLAVGFAYAADSFTSTNATIPQQNVTAAWKTWVLTAGKEMRLPQPSDASVSAGELEEVRTLLSKVDPAMQEKIKYWDFRSPAHQWNEVMTELVAASPPPPGHLFRASAMLNVALHDAMIAAWDSKYAYHRQRPAQVDPAIKPLVLTQSSPSYPCEHSVAAGVGATVLAHLFPKEAEKINAAAQEAAKSRVMAGAVFPSDSKLGFELGKNIAVKVIEHMKIDESKQTAKPPEGPGYWKGMSNPPGLNDMNWKRFVMTSPDQFRPAPPYAHDSKERAEEVAEIKNFKRTPYTNSKVFYWQYGQRGGPAYGLTLVEEIGKQLEIDGAHVSPPRAARAYALASVAEYEGWIASQDGKFHYWTARPNQIDSTVTTVIPTPVFPSYPSNNATIVSAPLVVLSYLFPREKERYEEIVREAGDSRVWAGIHFRSDITAGNEIGQKVGEAVIARARADGVDR